MAKQIRTIGFRNGLYVGQIDQSQKVDTVNGIGIVIDDMFLTCLCSWLNEGTDLAPKPTGPTLLLYPNREIFYSQNYPFRGKLLNFWCYITQQFKIYGNGQNNQIAILHSNSNTISQIKIHQNNDMQYTQDFTYQNEQQKWRIIQKIIKQQVNPHYKKLHSFILANFLQKLNRKQNQQKFIYKKKNKQIFYSMINKNQGIGFNLNLDNQEQKIQIKSIGYYTELLKIKQMIYGRLYHDEVNSNTYKIEQGNFQIGQTYNYSFADNRPSQSYKTSRKYYRQTTLFSNKFIQFSQADQIYKKLRHISKQYLKRIGLKYGQKIIQGKQKKQKQQDIDDILAEQNKKRSQKYNAKNNQKAINRQYNLNEAKAMIQAEVNKKKNNTGYSNNTGTFKNRFQTNEKIRERQSISIRSREKQYINLYKNTDRESKSNRTFIEKQSRSPRSSPRKYQYTESQAFQPQIKLINEPKISHSYQYTANTNQDRLNQNPNPLNNPTKTQQYPVKQFTLYPIPVAVQQDFTRYQKAQQQKNQETKRFNYFQKQTVLPSKQYQIPMDRYQKPKNIEKQNRQIKDEKLNNKREIGSYYEILQQSTNQPSHLPPHSIYNAKNGRLSTDPKERYNLYQHTPHSNNPALGTTLPTRKYFANFNYTQQKQPKSGQRQKQIVQHSPFLSRKPLPTQTKFSPISKLYIAPNPTKQIKQAQRQKSPLLARTGGKRTYTYVD